MKLSKELEKAQEKLDAFESQIKSATSDAQNVPVLEVDSPTKLSTREIDKTDGLVLKPDRTLGCKEPFNEAFRKDYEYMKEPVRFIADHLEIIGETLELWTRRFPGTSAEFWKVPTGKVVIGPRYLAEQIASKSYIRLKTEDGRITGSSSEGAYYGQLVASHKVQRLDARPAAGFNKGSKFG